jgi:hypothetical protein
MALADHEKASPLAFLTDNVIATTLTDTYASLAERRKALGLSNPGTVDGIAREVQRDVLLSNFMFQGLRCDLQKVFSVAPLFRIQHGFAMGSQALPPWQLMALYGTPKVRSPAGHPLFVATRFQEHSLMTFLRFSCKQPFQTINRSLHGVITGGLRSSAQKHKRKLRLARGRPWCNSTTNTLAQTSQHHSRRSVLPFSRVV